MNGNREPVSARPSYGEGVSFAVLSFVSIAVTGIVSSFVVARLYGIEVVGQYALAVAPATILWTLSTFQEQIALSRELSVLEMRSPRVTGLFAAVITFSLGLSVVVGTISVTVAYFLFNGPIGRPEVFVPTLVLVLEFVLVSNTSWNLDVVFASFRAGRRLFWIRLLHAVTYLGMAVAGAMVFDTVWGLVLAQVVAALTSLAIRVLSVRPFMRGRVAPSAIRDGFSALPRMIRFGAKLAPGGAAEGIGYQTGTWVLGITSSIASVGAWSRGWGLAQRLTDPSVRIVEMLFPTLIERRAGDDRAGFIRAVADSARLSAAALLLPGAVGGGAAVGVMELFGPGFSRAAEALAFLLLIPALHAVSNVQGAALAAGDRPLVSSVVTVGRTVVLVIAGIALSAWIGITGMALAMLLAYVIEVVWFALLVRSTFGSPGRILWPYRSFVAMVLAYGGGFAVARLLDGALSGVLGLGAGLVGGSIAYAAIFLLAGGLTAQDRTHVAALRRRLRARRVGPPVAPEGA